MKYSHYLTKLFSLHSRNAATVGIAFCACTAHLAQTAEGTEIDWATASYTVESSTTTATALSLGSTDAIYADMGGDMTGTSTASSAYAIQMTGAKIYGSISGDLTANAKYYAYGLSLTNGASIGVSGADDVIASNISATSSSTSSSNKTLAVSLNSYSYVYADFTGNITATAGNNVYGFYISDSSIVGSIGTADSSISATSSNNAAYGISISGVSKITGDIAGSIDVEAKGSAYGIYASGTSVSVGTSDTDTKISADISVTSTNGYAAGILFSSSTTYSDFTGTIDVSAATIAYGFNLSKATITGDIASDSISVTGTSMANGIYLWGTSSYNATIEGEISSDISVTATSSSSTAYGLNLAAYSSVGDVSGDIDVTGNTAYGIAIASTASIGDISGSISATGTTAYGIYTDSSETLSFGNGASVSAATTSSDGTAYAIYTSTDSLSLDVDGSLSISGNVSVNADGSGSLTIASGAVALSEGSKILADSITINEDATLSIIVSESTVLTNDSISGSGTISLSAGLNANYGDEFDISDDDNADFNSLTNLVVYGGTVSGNSFTVSESESLVLNASTFTKTNEVKVSANGILVVSDDTTSITMNFSTSETTTVYAVTTVTDATTVNGVDLAISFEDFVETSMGGSTIEVAEAYYFDVSTLGDNDSVEVIFYVGEDYDTSQITVYHLENGDKSWSDADQITSFTYDGQYLYVYVDGFSAIAYAVTSENYTIPEPSTATLSLLALAGLYARRRRK